MQTGVQGAHRFHFVSKTLKVCQPLKTNLHQELFNFKASQVAPTAPALSCSRTPNAEPEKPTTLGWRLVMARASGVNSLHSHRMHPHGLWVNRPQSAHQR